MEQEYLSCSRAFTPQCLYFSEPIVRDLFLLVNNPNRIGGIIPHEKIEVANKLCSTCRSFTPFQAK